MNNSVKKDNVYKNKTSWNLGAEKYSQKYHTDKVVQDIMEHPKSVFHHDTWSLIEKHIGSLEGKKICVPSSGDNHAVFAFAKMGAYVTSCDIAENQLIYAEKVADQYGLKGSIEFICQDTMTLDKLEAETYDMVFTSNGVHVWIDDLQGMYQSIYRIMKPSGIYLMHEIHPFQRPFDDNAEIVKSYDAVGPFDDGQEVTHHWRVMDIMNAISCSGLMLKQMEEMYCEIDYEEPFWMTLCEVLNGGSASKEEVERMHDWTQNPIAALPNWLDIVAEKK